MYVKYKKVTEKCKEEGARLFSLVSNDTELAVKI